MQSSENQNRARTFPSHCSWLCPLFSQWIITKCPLPASLETSMFTGTAQENMTCGFFFFLKHGLGWGRCGKRRKKQIYNLISASAKCYEKKKIKPQRREQWPAGQQCPLRKSSQQTPGLQATSGTWHVSWWPTQDWKALIVTFQTVGMNNGLSKVKCIISKWVTASFLLFKIPVIKIYSCQKKILRSLLCLYVRCRQALQCLTVRTREVPKVRD